MVMTWSTAEGIVSMLDSKRVKPNLFSDRVRYLVVKVRSQLISEKQRKNEAGCYICLRTKTSKPLCPGVAYPWTGEAGI